MILHFSNRLHLFRSMKTVRLVVISLQNCCKFHNNCKRMVQNCNKYVFDAILERFTLTLKNVTLTLHCNVMIKTKNRFFCEIHKRQSQRKFYLNCLSIFSCLFRCFRIGKPCQHAKREQKKEADSRLSCSSSGGQNAGHKIIYGFFSAWWYTWHLSQMISSSIYSRRLFRNF